MITSTAESDLVMSMEEDMPLNHTSENIIVDKKYLYLIRRAKIKFPKRSFVKCKICQKNFNYKYGYEAKLFRGISMGTRQSF